MRRELTHAQGLRRERMHASPLWSGEGFRNVQPIAPGLRSTTVPMPTLKDFLRSGGRRVPLQPLPALDPRATWGRVPQSGLRVTWLGHSTTLIEIGGRRVLTDPVWGPRASPLSLAGPKRFQPVPVPLRALAAVDLVVISHDHYDHLDYPTMRQLRAVAVPFVTSLGVGRIWRFRHCRGAHPRARLVGHVPAGAQRPDRDRRAVAAFLRARPARSQRDAVVLDGDPRRDHAVFFSGDTGLTPQYRLIGERLGPFDLVMLEVGAFHPAWGDIHLGPDHALEAHRLLGSGAFLPVHWGTFNLALHAWDQPAEVLYAAATSRSDARLLMPRLGEPIEPAHDLPLQPWWRAVDAGAAEAEPATLPAPAGVATAAPAEPQRPIPWPLD